MPKGGKLDTLIEKLTRSMGSKSYAIATLKKQGTIKQKGKHLVATRRLS